MSDADPRCPRCRHWGEYPGCECGCHTPTAPLPLIAADHVRPGQVIRHPVSGKVRRAVAVEPGPGRRGLLTFIRWDDGTRSCIASTYLLRPLTEKEPA